MKKSRQYFSYVLFILFFLLFTSPVFSAVDKRFERFKIGSGKGLDPATAFGVVFGLIVIGFIIYYLCQYYIKFLKPNSAAILFKNDDLYKLLQKTHQLTYRESFAMYRLCRNKKISYPSILFLRPKLFEKYILEYEGSEKPETIHLKTIQKKIHKGVYPAPLIFPDSQV